MSSRDVQSRQVVRSVPEGDADHSGEQQPSSEAVHDEDAEAEDDAGLEDAAPQEQQQGAPAASFTVNNPLSNVPPATFVSVLAVALGALVVRVVRGRGRGRGGRRKRARGDKLSAAWAWQSSDAPPQAPAPELSRPLLGSTLVVAEKCAPTWFALCLSDTAELGFAHGALMHLSVCTYIRVHTIQCFRRCT